MSADYDRRNARAQALGYANYYDYRIHDSGRIAPEVPVTEAMRSAFRGHAHEDLMRFVERNAGRDLEVLPAGLNRDDRGRWTQVDVLVRMPDGSTRRFVLRGKQASADRLAALKAALVAAGIPYARAKSIDVFADADEAAAEEAELADEG